MTAITSTRTIKPPKLTFNKKEQYVVQCTININPNSKRIFKRRNSNHETKKTRKSVAEKGNKFRFSTENENENE